MSNLIPFNGARSWGAHVVGLSCCVAAWGCVASHEDGDFINSAAATFHGVAAEPNETISIYARHQQSQQWELIQRFVSEPTPFGIGNPISLGGQTGSVWQTKINFHGLDNFECFFGATGTCTIPPEGSRVELQFRSGPEQDETILYSHESGGIDCTLEHISQGQSWSEAGNACAAGDTSPDVLTLQVAPADPFDAEQCDSGPLRQWQQLIHASNVGHYNLNTIVLGNADPEVATTLRNHFPQSMLVGLSATDNATTGLYSFSERRAYYAFDLADQQGKIIEAQFRFFAQGIEVFDDLTHANDAPNAWGTPPIPYLSDDPTELFELHSVSTDVELLLSPASNDDIGNAFEDLLDGPALAALTITPQVADEWLEMPLGSSVLPSLNAAQGSGKWALGGGISSLQSDTVRNGEELVFINHALYGASTSAHFALPPQLLLTLQCGTEAAAVPISRGSWAAQLLAGILCCLGWLALSRRRPRVRLH